MAISTIYFRHKTPHGWRYLALGIGRRSEAARNGPFFIRVRDGANKYKWQKHETENAAKKAAERAPVTRKAQELGLLPDDVTNETNKNRVPIETAVENYLNERRFGRPSSIKAYENVFDQLLANLCVSMCAVASMLTTISERLVRKSNVNLVYSGSSRNRQWVNGVLPVCGASNYITGKTNQCTNSYQRTPRASVGRGCTALLRCCKRRAC